MFKDTKDMLQSKRMLIVDIICHFSTLLFMFFCLFQHKRIAMINNYGCKKGLINEAAWI